MFNSNSTLKSLTLAIPIAPKIQPQLDNWSGSIATEVELSDCSARDTDFSGARRFEAEDCRLSAVQLAGAKFDKLQMSDVVLGRVEAAGMRAPETAWLRIAVKNSRFTGADFGAGLLEDCVFENVKFDEAGFRFVTLKRARFENCVLRNADFSGAKLSHVSFSGCDLDGTNFDNAACKLVDLRGETLNTVRGISGLKGAVITSEQVVQLAPLLAAAAGLDVDDET